MRASAGAAGSGDADRSSGAAAPPPARPHENPPVAPCPAPAGGKRAVILAPDEEAGARRVGQERCEGPEEAGLLDVRTAVLGAEDVAVPAVVTGVGPVRELVRRPFFPAHGE